MSALLRLLSALAAVAAVAPSNARAENDQAPPAFVLVIDATNSMTSKIKGAVKLDMAKAAFSRSMASAPRQATAALLSFGDQPTRACEDVTPLLPLAPADKSANAIRSAFAKLEPKTSGKTPILAAAAQAAQIIGAQGRGASGGVIVVADGGDDCSPTACETARAFHTQHPNLPVHIISLRPDRLIGAQLQCIASETGGQYSEAQTEQQIGQALATALRYVPAPLVAVAPAAPAVTPAAAPPPALASSPATPTAPQSQATQAQANPVEPQTNEPQPTATTAASQLAPANTARPGRTGPAPNVTLRAALAAGSAPLTQGVGWRVFTAAAARNKDGSKATDNSRSKDSSKDRPLWTGAGAEARIRLAPGSYYAEAAFGLVRTGSQITVPANGEVEMIVPLNAGVINLRAVGRPGGTPLDRVFYRLFNDAPGDSSGAPAEIGRSSLAQAIFYVPAGSYRVTAEHGSAAAALPVTVAAGASVALDVPMNAGSLKLQTRIEPAAGSPAGDAATAPEPQFFYQVFAVDGASPNPGREIARSSAAGPSFDLPQGAYHVTVRYDLATAERDVKVAAGEETNETIGLSAGGIALSSKAAGKTGVKAGSISHIIYQLPATPGGEMTEIARAPNTGRVLHLNSGLYRVVSQYGPHNVRETADVAIKSGEIQKIEFELHLAEARLTLDGRRGGRRIAWTITDASGQEAARSEEVEPEFVLKPGAYKAEARVGTKTYSATFELGDNQKKTVAASAQ